MTRSGRSLVLCLVVAGCAHAPPPPPAPPPEPLACTRATYVFPDEPHPVRVEVVNDTDREVRLLVDRCLRWTSLGEVGPGATAYFRLPERLMVRYGDGLRFNAYTNEPSVWYGRFESDFGVPLAHLRISAETALPNEFAMDTVAAATPRTEHVLVQDFDGVSTVSAFSFNSFAVLLWRCGEDGPEVTLSSGGHLDGDPRVTLTAGDEERAFGAWHLIRAFTDGAAAPAAVVAPFTAAIRRTRAVTLLVGPDGGSSDRYGFNTEGLDAALTGLACVR